MKTEYGYPLTPAQRAQCNALLDVDYVFIDSDENNVVLAKVKETSDITEYHSYMKINRAGKALPLFWE